MKRLPLRFSALAILVFALTKASAKDDVPKPIQDLAEMSKNGTLFSKDSYKTVRGHCSKMFVEGFGNEIKSAYGDDFDELTAWLEKNKEIKEEFYTAIDEKADKVNKALKIFHDLWKQSPANVAAYPNLAIAHAIVWDDARGVYDYRHHQKRTEKRLAEQLS